ncbi:MAG: excinuclease ABC subunit UvrB [Candidatus Omnitrophica bacterium]|nr:excinuclease ABC subunit UvrB [Candidatus Omnitrophota bacterium]
MKMPFKLVSSFKPEGDQPQAIEKLAGGLARNKQYQTLLGVTGSGKTFSMASVIAMVDRPTLVISHNKTLAAQLYSEFKEFFPKNAVEYFVSYYDYYQPEAYIPQRDIYIEKDASINEDIDRLRLSATSSLMSRRDCLIVSSVSCIYGLGSPEEYGEMLVFLEESQEISRDEILRKLISIHYTRNDYDLKRSTFRVRGDTVEIFPAYTKTAYRVEQSGDRIERIYEIDPLTGNTVTNMRKIGIYPAKHFVTTPDRIKGAIVSIEEELVSRLAQLRRDNKLVEAQRLESRTKYDLEMMREVGYCNGIENYSRHVAGRPAGSRPWCLMDYFPKDFLLFIDESHVTVPQIGGMYYGDKARKETLIEYGFRLPSALDNRPLKFEEFEILTGDTIYVSATPSEYELKRSAGQVVEQVIRPTGLIDPPIEVRPTKGQMDDLIKEIRLRAAKKERILVTTITKRLSEDLTRFLKDFGLRVKYLHSEIDAIERVEILRDLRLNKFDCLVGINLLREGLDLPEVSLVAILDADKEGFLRSETSLIQVAGRAARHINGEVIMYADRITRSMKKTIDETDRRRGIQIAFNKKHNITPHSIEKAVKEGIESYKKAREVMAEVVEETDAEYDITSLIGELQHDMEIAARNLQFERAAILRDQIKELRERLSKPSLRVPPRLNCAARRDEAI